MNDKEKELQTVQSYLKQEETSFERLINITERIASTAIAVSFLLLTAACLATL